MIRSLLISLTTIALVVMSSCSSSDELFEYVPTDIEFAMTANCGRIMSNLGIELTDNGIKGHESLKTILKDVPAEFTENLIGFGKIVNMDEIIVFGYAKGHSYTLTRITNKKALTEQLTKSGATKETAGNYEIYCDHGRALIVDEDMLWMTLGDNTEALAKEIDKIKATAQESNITADTGLVKALKADNAINFTCRLSNEMTAVLTGGNDIRTTLALSALMPSLNSYRLEGGIDVDESDIELKARIVNPETGENLNIPLLKEIDRSILSYIPDEYTVAVVAGLNSEQFTELTATIKNFASADPTIAKALEMFGNIDGTVGVACTPATLNNLGSADNTDRKSIAFARTKPGKAKEMSDYIVSMLKLSPGVQSSTNGTVTMLTGPKSAPRYVTAENNLLFISSEPVKKASNKLTDKMKGAQLSYAVNIPSISDITKGKCTFGLKGYATYSNGSIKAKLETTGTDLLSAYASVIAALTPDTNSESYWDEPGADETIAIPEI